MQHDLNLTSAGFKAMAARSLAEDQYANGYRPRRLLSQANTKLMKADWNIGLSLAPALTSGYQVCASASPECMTHCIHTSGFAAPNFHGPNVPCNPVWVARILKTIWLFRDRRGFLEKLYKDIALNREASIRLNVFSDWMWERQSVIITPDLADHYGTRPGTFSSLMEVFPETQFYDYTKHHARMFRPRPANYHLTFSLMETNEVQARGVLRAGMNVAAVTTSKTGYLLGYPVIDGDINDLRFLDPQGVIVGLKPKGSLWRSQSEFKNVPTELQWALPDAA